MSKDYQLISQGLFNKVFKNNLRDIFVYQFKDRKTDFKVKGSGDKGDDKIIDYHSFMDAMRQLRYIIERDARIKWDLGDVPDSSNKNIHPTRKNKSVMCVTADSRQIAHNPFFALYNYCLENIGDKDKRGDKFAFYYAVVLYFNLWKTVTMPSFIRFETAEKTCLEKYLKHLVEILADNRGSRSYNLYWDELSKKTKETLSKEVIEKFYDQEIISDGHFEEYVELSEAEKAVDLNKVREKIIRYKHKIIFKKDGFKIVKDTSLKLKKSYLETALNLNAFSYVGERQFNNRIFELEQLGVLIKEEIGGRAYYSLSECNLLKIISNEELLGRFRDMVSFFSETSVLGEVGSYILQRLPTTPRDKIYFKHHYIKSPLNDFNISDLLYVIKCVDRFMINNAEKLRWCYLEYRNASNDDLAYQTFTCLPIEIRQSTTDGRQSLVYYHPGFRSISAAPIDFIDNIEFVEMDNPDYLEEDLKRAKRLLSYTWGISFSNFKNGNVTSPCDPNRVRIIIKYAPDEKYILARVKSELRQCATCKEFIDDKHGNCIEVIVNVVDYTELKKWLRTFTTRIVKIEINGKIDTSLESDVFATYCAYTSSDEKSEAAIPSTDGKVRPLREKNPNENIDNKQLTRLLREKVSTLLFNDLYSVPFYEFSEVLFELIDKKKFSNKNYSQMELSYAEGFGSTIFKDDENKRIIDNKLTQIRAVRYYFADYKQKSVKSIFKLMRGVSVANLKSSLPLSKVEIQWLLNILSHPLAECFLSGEEIKQIEKCFDDPNLFNINDVVLYDQHILPENEPQDGKFCETVKHILAAIDSDSMIEFEYTPQSGETSIKCCFPSYLEYSKRDNKFRIRAVNDEGQVSTYNVERISSITVLYDLKFDPTEIRQTIDAYITNYKKELVVYFKETKNVPTRLLTEFSCFKKRCMKWEDNTYRMDLSYDEDDLKDYLIRLLSYGPYVTISDDTGNVKDELLERVKNQLELFEHKEYMKILQQEVRDI